MPTTDVRTSRDGVDLVIRADEYSLTVSVELSNGRTNTVEVNRPYRPYAGGEVYPATVNWSALGSRSPDDALRYASAIAEAVEVAKAPF